MGCSTILDMAPPNPSRSLVTNSAYPTICPVNEPFPVDYHSNRNKGSCNKKGKGDNPLASSTVPLAPHMSHDNLRQRRRIPKLELLAQAHLDRHAVDRGTPAHVLGVDAANAKEVDIILACAARIDPAHDVT